MIQRIMGVLFFVAAAFMLSSCVPAEFEKPLSDGKNAVIDRDLIGMWHGKKDDVDCYLIIGASDESRQMDLICVGNEKGKGAEVMVFTAFPTFSRKSKYLNVRRAVQISPENFGPDKVKYSDKYYLVRYEVSLNKLRMWYADDCALDEAIKRGELQGKIKDQTGTLTDSPENIMKFLDNAGKCGEYDVFSSFGEFSRN